jgi:hypothetical protein
MWQNWINALLGLVVLGVAVFAGLDTAVAWTLGIAGAAVTLLAFWSASDWSETGELRHV